MPTSALATKKYLQTKLSNLITDYNDNMIVTFGAPAQDNLSMTLIVGDIGWESTEVTSWGARQKVTEIYHIECHLVVAQADGKCIDVETTAYEIFDVANEAIRNDPSLGYNVDFSSCKPTSCQSAPGTTNGAVAVLLFNVQCEKELE